MENEEQINISKYEYDCLKMYEKEFNDFHYVDFGLKIESGAVLPPENPYYNDGRIEMEIFNMENYSIQIEGNNYNIKNQNHFDKIKQFISDNLETLINYSKIQDRNYLNSHIYEGGFGTSIVIKYGQLIINIDGQVKGEIGDFCEQFIQQLKHIILYEG